MPDFLGYQGGVNKTHTAPTTRRHFLRTMAAASLAVAALPLPAFSARPVSVAWRAGGVTRPWSRWTFDEMLDGAYLAGIRVFGYLTPTVGDEFLASDSREYLATLRRKVAAKGLTAISGRVRTREGVSYEENIAEIRRQIDNAHILGLSVVVHTGANRPEGFSQYYRVMNYAAGYAQDLGIQLATKPHGGVNAASAELLRCLEEVNHPNFKIWYDTGNIIHYTGKDPVKELEPIASHVTGVFAKDCAELKGPVMIQFGTGKVDFEAILRKLAHAGFNGPIMVETCEVDENSIERTTENARANREYLARIISRIDPRGLAQTTIG